MFQKKETYHESDDLNRINSRKFTCLPLFALLVTHKEKNVSLAYRSIWKRPNSRQPVFRPEVPPAPSTWKRPVREAKFNLKYYTGWNARFYIYTDFEDTAQRLSAKTNFRDRILQNSVLIYLIIRNILFVIY